MDRFSFRIRDVLNRHLGGYVIIEAILLVLWLGFELIPFDVFITITVIYSVIQLYTTLGTILPELTLWAWMIVNLDSVVMTEFNIRKKRGEIDISPNAKVRAKQLIDLFDKIMREIGEV